MQERCEKLQSNIQDLEGKGQSLQTTIDRLSMALAKSEEEEHQQKDKVCTCSSCLYVISPRILGITFNFAFCAKNTPT